MSEIHATTMVSERTIPMAPHSTPLRSSLVESWNFCRVLNIANNNPKNKNAQVNNRPLIPMIAAMQNVLATDYWTVTDLWTVDLPVTDLWDVDLPMTDLWAVDCPVTDLWAVDLPVTDL